MHTVIQTLFADGITVPVKKGTVLIAPDTEPRGVYCIREGYIKVYGVTSDGIEKIHTIYKPVEIFPLLWTFHAIHKPLFYEAMEEGSLTLLPKDVFVTRLQENPDMLLKVTETLAKLFEIFIDRVDMLEVAKAAPRLISYLLFLAKRFGVAEGATVKIQVPLTHADIAGAIALTRETVSREIEHLVQKKLITTENHRIVIHNIHALHKALEIPV